MADGSKTRTVYHYTDENGKNAIVKSGKIEPSSRGAFGAGAYFTSIPPSAGRKVVSQNNWDGSSLGTNMERQGRADYVVQVELPAHKVKEHPTQRDILTVDGPVVLKDHKWKTMHK